MASWGRGRAGENGMSNFIFSSPPPTFYFAPRPPTWSFLFSIPILPPYILYWRPRSRRCYLYVSDLYCNRAPRLEFLLKEPSIVVAIWLVAWMFGSEVTYCRICVVFTTDMNLHVRRLAHYVEAATNRLGFKSPDLSTKQTEMPRTRFVTNMVSTPYCRWWVGKHVVNEVLKHFCSYCFWWLCTDSVQ